MNTYIALFRGINVGGKNILLMKDLVGILEGMGFRKIQTYIQSGNVTFQSTRKQTETMASETTLSISKAHGFAPKVLLLEFSEFQDAIEKCPFKTAEGKALHFFFLESKPIKADLEALMSVKSRSEEFKLYNKTFYLHAPDGIGRSRLATKVEKSMGVPGTARNWNTVSKLMSMAER